MTSQGLARSLIDKGVLDPRGPDALFDHSVHQESAPPAAPPAASAPLLASAPDKPAAASGVESTYGFEGGDDDPPLESHASLRTKDDLATFKAVTLSVSEAYDLADASDGEEFDLATAEETKLEYDIDRRENPYNLLADFHGSTDPKAAAVELFAINTVQRLFPKVARDTIKVLLEEAAAAPCFESARCSSLSGRQPLSNQPGRCC
jgi:hypothetical protein